jgi:hypothetical protein
VRTCLAADFNQSTLDPAVPADQGMAVLKESNEIETRHDEFEKSLAPGVIGASAGLRVG